MGRVFAIGDIHGCYKTLKTLLFDEIKITKDDELIFLGDLIDRGLKSKKVLKLILRLQKNGFNVSCLMGNHEIMLLKSIKSEVDFKHWIKYGGKETLESFKVSHPKYIKDKYLDFVSGFKNYIEFKDFILVHGGLNFEIDNPLLDLDSMAWIRNNKVDSSKINNRRIIVGHTPSTLKDIKKSLKTDRLLLDGGCVYKNKEDLGYLVALELNEMSLFYYKNID